MSSSSTRTTPETASAARSSTKWRVVDIVIVAIVAVAVGLIFRLWAAAWGGFQLMFLAYPPGIGIFSGMFVLAGPLAMYIVRKPGAAVIAEVLAAVFEAVLGSHFGTGAIMSGLIQGAMAEVAFAAFRYRVYSFATLMLSGILAGLGLGVHEVIIYYSEWAMDGRLVYIVLAVISGLVFGGLLSWIAHRTLAAAGALSAFDTGRARAEV